MDITKDMHKPVQNERTENVKRGLPQTPAQYLCYWLQAIYNKASEQGLEPNLALVLTHKDLIQAKDAKQYINNYIGKVLDIVEGKPYSSYLSRNNVYVADNKSNIHGELNSLRHKIFKKFTAEKSWGQEIPARWLKFEADLLQKTKKTLSPYIHISATKESALACGMDNQEMKSFLELHHFLGTVIHYSDPALKNIIV